MESDKSAKNAYRKSYCCVRQFAILSVVNWLTSPTRCRVRTFAPNTFLLTGAVWGATSLFGSGASAAPTLALSELQRQFTTPPARARPWVYWYFMDGNVTKEGLHNDLEAMKKPVSAAPSIWRWTSACRAAQWGL